MLRVQVICFIFLLGTTLHNVVGKSILQRDMEINERIVGGDEVEIEQYPHQVVIMLDNHLVCGGSIISDEHILSAAHCMLFGPENYQVRLGSKTRKSGGAVYNITSATSHPKFTMVGFADYDIAIMKTSQKMKLDGVTSKAVVLADSDSVLEPGEKVNVTGWGKLGSQAKVSEVLMSVTLPIVNLKTCQDLWLKNLNVTLSERFICAGMTPDKSACHGDSGGPLVAVQDFKQYGIVSGGSPTCDQLVPNAYTSVPYLRDWIKEVSGV